MFRKNKTSKTIGTTNCWDRPNANLSFTFIGDPETYRTPYRPDAEILDLMTMLTAAKSLGHSNPIEVPLQGGGSVNAIPTVLHTLSYQAY